MKWLLIRCLIFQMFQEWMSKEDLLSACFYFLFFGFYFYNKKKQIDEVTSNTVYNKMLNIKNTSYSNKMYTYNITYPILTWFWSSCKTILDNSIVYLSYEEDYWKNVATILKFIHDKCLCHHVIGILHCWYKTFLYFFKCFVIK